jgi:type I restriction enzyme R subunit
VPATDTSERGLEALIVKSLVEEAGYLRGDPADYDRDHAVDLRQLLTFLEETQPEAFERLNLAQEGHQRLQFLSRLQGEIAKRSIVDVLRKAPQGLFIVLRIAKGK